MEELNLILSLLFGFILRIAIPVLITVLLARGLKKLDAKWKEDGQQVSFKEILANSEMVEEMACYEFFDCPEEKRENCEASNWQGTYCWDVREKVNDNPEKCLDCKYKEAIEEEKLVVANYQLRNNFGADNEK